MFKIETKYGPDYVGGSNELVEMRQAIHRRFLFSFDFQFLKIKSEKYKPSNVPDFISDGKTVLDKIKHVFFMYFYWVTLSM